MYQTVVQGNIENEILNAFINTKKYQYIVKLMSSLDMLCCVNFKKFADLPV